MGMKQQCHLLAIWLTWLGVPALVIVMGLLHGWLAAGFVLLVGVVGQLAYLRWFPRVSRLLGYGSVADVPAERITVPLAWPRVTLYTANVCPFCPLVKRRLEQLQRDLDFEFDEVDVTFRPNLIRSKGFRSVPVLEADGRFLVGNATTADLAAFLTEDRGEASQASA